MSIKKLIYISCLAVLLLIGFWYLYLRNANENRLMREGKEVVKKIEYYRTEKKKLPASLSEIGFIEDDRTDLYLQYTKVDSIRYYIWLGMSLEESKFYYSDSKRWENSLREMK